MFSVTHSIGEMVQLGDELVMSIGPLARAGVLDARNRICLGFYHRPDPKPWLTVILGKGCEVLITSKLSIKVLSITHDNAIRLEYDAPSDMAIGMVTPREAHIAKQSGYALIKQGPMAGQPVMRLHEAGRTDPHVLLMIAILAFALSVPMSCALKARHDETMQRIAARQKIERDAHIRHDVMVLMGEIPEDAQ